MRQPSVVLLFLLSSCGSPAAFNQDTTKAAAVAAVNSGAAGSAGDATAAAAAAMALTSIAISPEKPTLALGSTQQFTATGTLSDGSKKDVTALVSWSLGDGGALEQSDGANHPGLIKAAAEGDGLLKATSGGITASTAVSVSAATIVSIAVQTSPALTAGAPAAVKAIATFSDGHTADVTSQVDWSVNGAPAGGASGNGSGTGASSSTASNGSGSAGAAAGATFTSTPGSGTTVTLAGTGPSTITATLGSTSGDTKVSVNGGLVCATRESIVKSSTSTTLTWSGTTSGDTVYTVVPTTMAPPVDIGTVTSVTATDGTHKAVYHAPSAVALSFDVKIVATPKNAADTAGSCSIRLSADGAIGVVDNGTTEGPVGNVYQIPAGQQVGTTTLTAAWFTQTPIANIVMANFDVPNTPYELGFPGFPTLTAWFSVRFDGQLNIPTPGAYTFQLNADDGAILYIDGLPVVNDDGVHSIKLATGAPVQLTAGMHTFRLDYFEGPPVYLALQMMWKGPNDSGFSIVPASFFSRPKTP